MRIFRDLNQLPNFKNAVITIGSFDGVHRGHQKLIRRVNQLAREVHGEPVIITFHPHPRQIVYPQDKSLRLLTTLDEKVRLFEKFGVQNLVIVPFTVEFSQLHPVEYIDKFIVKKFNPRFIVIGYDHHFGINRGGDIDLLKSFQEKYNYEVIEIEKQLLDDISISSTKIRKALQDREILTANELLNHQYTLEGTVIKGEQLGRKLGFPTANLRVENTLKLLPPSGIYACYAYFQDVRFDAMLYIGDRPTIGSEKNHQVEVHIIDFNDTIYGKRLRIDLVAYVREDRKFDSLHNLRSQIKMDQADIIRILRGSEERIAAKYNPHRVAAVILNFNGEGLLKEYLPNMRLVLDQKVEIVVADNNSTDRSLDYLKKHHPEVDRVELRKNYGYAGGYNKAIREVNAKYIALINSDISFDENWITPIVEFMEKNPDVAICQPAIRDLNNRRMFEYAGAAGGWLDSLAYPFCEGRLFESLEPDEEQFNYPHEIFWASGAACVVNKELFEAFGGFDSNFFAHQEEIDLCWRLKRAGYKVYTIPTFKVYHLGGGTLNYQSPRKTFLNFRNNLGTIYKNESTLMLLWMIPVRLLFDSAGIVLFLTKGRLGHALAVFRAYGSFLVKIVTWFERRRKDRAAVKRLAIGPPNLHKGRYDGFVALDYYILKRKKFDDLPIHSSRKDGR